MTKYCPRCKTEKDTNDFGKHRQGRDGFRPICKKCRNIETLKYTESIRRSRRDRIFGAGSTEHFYQQLEKQKSLCAICGEPGKLGKGGFGLDHNHTTGQWRGALCARCNSGVGDFRENPKTLMQAILYLKEWGSK